MTDCFTKRWPADACWTVVWHDIWQPMLQENLEQMAQLHALFEDRADWQGSWGRDWLQARHPTPIAVATYGP